MQKIRLDLDALDVVSFATDGEDESPRGTVHGQDSMNSFFTLNHHDSCYGMCMTYEYDTCHEAGPTVGPSCYYYCLAYTVGCYPETQAPTCAETCVHTCA